MALPTITHNSPSPGWISWSATNVSWYQYDFSIPAGSTDKTYTWWEFRGGVNPAVVSSNTFPTHLEETPEDLFLFLNKNGVGFLVPEGIVLNGALLVPSTVYADAIEANAIQTRHLDSDVVTADEIAADAVQAEHVSAGAITVDKLTSGSVGDNLVLNGSLEEADENSIPLGFEFGALTNFTAAYTNEAFSSGARSLKVTASSTTADMIFRQSTDKLIPVYVATNRRWYVSARIGSLAATTSGASLRVNWYDGNRVLLSSGNQTTVQSAATLTAWGWLEGQVTPPANAKFMGVELRIQNPNVATTFYIDSFQAREMVIAAQIGDGQITATKIQAGAVSAQAVAARAIGAQHLMLQDLNNYWQNGTFQDDTVGQLPAGIASSTGCRVKDISAWAGPVAPALVNGTTAGNNSTKALEIDAWNGSNNDVYDNNYIPVNPGDKFYVTAEARYLNTAGTIGSGRIGFRVYDRSKVHIAWTVTADLGTTKTQFMTPMAGVYEVPSGVFYLQPWISFSNNGETTNKFIIDNIRYTKLDNAEMIADGAITATKIKADAVESDKIKANAVVADKIAAGAVVARTLAIGDFTNLAFGGEFDDLKALTNWNYPTDVSFTSLEAYSGGGSIVCAPGGSVRIMTQQAVIPVKEGDEFSFSMWYKTSADFNGTGNSKFRLADQADNLLYSWGIGVAADWTPQVGTYIVPAGVKALRLAIYFDQTVGSAWVDSVTFQKKLASVQIKDGAITADHVDAGSIWTDSAWLGEASASSLTLSSVGSAVSAIANYVDENNVTQTGATVWSRPKTTVSPAGLHIVNVMSTDAAGSTVIDEKDVVKLGVFTTDGVDDDDDYFSIDKAGVPQITMNSEGDLTAQKLFIGTSANAGTIMLNGDDVGAQLRAAPRGIVAWGQWSSSSGEMQAMPSLGSTGGDVGLFEIGWDTSQDNPDRMYNITLAPFLVTLSNVNTTTGSTVGLRMWITTNGTRPQVGVGTPSQYQYVATKTNGFQTLHMPTKLLSSSNGNYIRVLFSVYANCGVDVYDAQNVTLLINDLGEYPQESGVVNNSGGSNGGTQTTAPTVTPKVTKTVEWGYTSVRSFSNVPTGAGVTGGSFYNYNTSKGYQGLSPAGYGNLGSMFLFPDTINSTLDGATINGVWIYLYFEHWYYASGGTAVIRLHNKTTTQSQFNALVNGMDSPNWPRAAGRWVAVPSSIWSQFDTTFKGVSLRGNGGYGTYGIANNCRIRIKYTK